MSHLKLISKYSFLLLCVLNILAKKANYDCFYWLITANIAWNCLLFPQDENSLWKAITKVILRTVDLRFSFNDLLKLNPSQGKNKQSEVKAFFATMEQAYMPCKNSCTIYKLLRKHVNKCHIPYIDWTERCLFVKWKEPDGGCSEIMEPLSG